MFHLQHSIQIGIVGVALTGTDDSPVVVFESHKDGDFLILSVSPFDAEAVIRECTGDGAAAVAWLAELLRKNPPCRGSVERSEDESMNIRFFGANRRSGGSWLLSLGDGFGLANKLNLPLFADTLLLQDCRNQLAWFPEEKIFGREFLYLTPTEYAPKIPLV